MLYQRQSREAVNQFDDTSAHPNPDYIVTLDPAPADSTSDEEERLLNKSGSKVQRGGAHAPPESAAQYLIRFTTASAIEPEDLERCLTLVERTSGAAYRNSNIGWSATKKRAEMKLPDMKYLLFTTNEGFAGYSPSYRIQVVCSFMLTYEDGNPVIYIYEIHMKPKLRGRGVGQKLMGMVEDIGRDAGVKKSMLTVFMCNVSGRSWYERMGYMVDEFSPSPRVLRGGKVKEPDYVILCNDLSGGESVEVYDEGFGPQCSEVVYNAVKEGGEVGS